MSKDGTFECFPHGWDPGEARETVHEILRIPLLEDNYTYLILDGDKAAVIDPTDASPVLSVLKDGGLKDGRLAACARAAGSLAGVQPRLTLILCTHHHLDHTGGNVDLRDKTGATVTGPDDRRVPGLEAAVGEGERIPFGSIEIRVISVPGHTKTHLAYFLPHEKTLFSGDCLFPAGCGRVIEGSHGDMWSSLGKLAALPDDTLVLAGHEYTLENLAFALSIDPGNKRVRSRYESLRAASERGLPFPAGTLAEERSTNPFLRAWDPALKKALRMEFTPDADVFAALRKLKDRFVW